MLAVVKYNAGNIRSVLNALRRLGADPVLTDDARLLQQADRVVFPGQGEAGSAMAYLRERGLDQVIRGLRQPVLGVCVGQQLLCQHSEEGDTDCLGIFSTDVRRFQPQTPDDKVPAMGWNRLFDLRSPLFAGLTDPYVYFVHSYYASECEDSVLATAEYGAELTAAVGRENVLGCQFHPEKSGPVGLNILRAFCEM